MATDIVLFPGVDATAHPMRGLASVAGPPTLQRSKPAAEVTRFHFSNNHEHTRSNIHPQGTHPSFARRLMSACPRNISNTPRAIRWISIREYAARRNMEIVIDLFRRGQKRTQHPRTGILARMIADVQNKRADYKCILVYDISRWGRFQDADESAHYEYSCRQAGIAVHYCAEQFENDGTPSSTIIKTVKRAMAGEYSRELSSKVFQGACRLIQLGFKQGGTAGFGLRRMLVDHTGQQKGLLKMGEHKSIQTDRVILVPGPDEEVAIVRWMYDAFVKEGKSEWEIAKLLNERGILTDFQRAWTRGTVHEVLTNEKYIGNNVYHRTSCKLKQEARRKSS